jgi:hypothetical protein
MLVFRVLPYNLYAFGRRPAPRPPRKIDFAIEGLDDSTLIGPQQPPNPKGASTTADPDQSGLEGYYHRLPRGTRLPDGLAALSDRSMWVASTGRAIIRYTQRGR